MTVEMGKPKVLGLNLVEKVKAKKIDLTIVPF